jgi:hypothetical protein
MHMIPVGKLSLSDFKSLTLVDEPDYKLDKRYLTPEQMQSVESGEDFCIDDKRLFSN